jgi:hypothetical protein
MTRSATPSRTASTETVSTQMALPDGPAAIPRALMATMPDRAGMDGPTGKVAAAPVVPEAAHRKVREGVVEMGEAAARLDREAMAETAARP